MASVRLDHVHKTYPNGHVAARDIDLEIADGELLVLVGPSGSGKSTLLRIVAGLETPSGGRVFLGGADVTDLPPHQRGIAMVFQSFALYPHKTVRENLAFGLRLRRVAIDTIEERVREAAQALQIESLLDRRPAQLSGGERQRVALGRAIVSEPRAFLLDEPLSNFDATLRVETRAELARMHRQLGATMLYVTHDQAEAMTLGDRIAVLRDGRLQQVAPPMEVYRRPGNTFVAGFIGSPAMNFFQGTLRTDAATTRLELDGITLQIESPETIRPRTPLVVMGVRPQEIAIVSRSDADIHGRVELIEPLGHEMLAHVSVQAGDLRPSVRVVTSTETELAVGREVGLRLRRDRLHFFDAASENRLEPRSSTE